MKNKKFILFIILVCSFLFISVLIPSLAKLVTSKTSINNEWNGSIASSFNSGSGTIDSPYIISNASEFTYFKETLKKDDYKNKYIKITNDIILNSGLFKDDEKLEYIKDDVTYYLDSNSDKYYEDNSFDNYVGTINEFETLKTFNGTLDGDNHTIYGLYIKEDNSSLFENIGGNISNLIIENAYIYGEYSSAGLTLNSNESIIKNVIVDGNILSNGNETQYMISNNIDDLVIDDEATLNINVNLPDTSDYKFLLSGTCTGDTSFTVDGKVIPCKDFEVNVNPFNFNIQTNSRIYLTNLKYNYSYDTSISAGVILKANDSSVENVVNRANVKNKLASGIVGILKNTNISKSYNLGNINGNKSSGLVDTIISSNSSLNYIYNEGNLTNNSAGLVSNIIDSNIDISNSYNTYNTSALGNIDNSYLSINNSYNKVPDDDFLTYNNNSIRVLFDNDDFIYDEAPLIKLDYDNLKYVNIVLNDKVWNSYKEDVDFLSYDENLSLILVSTKEYKAIKGVYYYLSEDELSKENLDNINWNDYNTPISLKKRGTYILYVKVINYNDEATYLNTDRIYLYVDDIYASIKVDDKTYDDLHNPDYCFINNKKIEINAYSKNDIKSIKYLVSDIAFEQSDLEVNISWITYQESISIKNDSIIYVKVEDNNSNIIYLNSDHFIDTKYNITNLKSGNDLKFNSNMTYNSSISFNVLLDNSDVTLNGFERSIISNEVLPINTHIVINDLTNNKIYEYFVKENEEKEILLSKFNEAGVTSEINYSNEYTNKDKFHIIIDFKNIEETEKEYNIFFKAKRVSEELTSDTISFKLNSSLDDINSKLNIINVGNNISINYNYLSTTIIKFNTSFNSTYLNTNLEDLDKTLIIEVIDKDNNIVNKDKYKSLKFIYNGVSYSPNNTNKTLIKLDNLNNIGETLTIKTSEDISGLLDGDNTLKITLGLTFNNLIKYRSNNSINIPIVINKRANNYGFGISTNKRIISANDLFKFNINASIDNPTIEVSLYKKKERNGTNQEYTKVNISDYINESINTISNGETQVSFKDDVEKNSYMFEFTLYDGDTLVGKNSIKVVVR